MKNEIIFALVLICALSFLAITGEAKTEIRKTGECEYTVYIFMAFVTDNTSLMSTWESQIETTWNGPNGYQTFGDCDCKVKFDAVMKNVSDCNGTLGTGWHCYNVTNNTTNRRNNTADATITRPNTTDSFGEWTERTSGFDAAHEAGHAMGLGEEYNYTNGTYMVSGNDSMSIMARTWKNSTGHPPHANQWHINEIMAGIDCPDICCCGNGRADAGKEECEKNMTPSGCPENQTCNDECKCVGAPVATPRCGDGVLYRPPNYGQPGVGGEECDWNATPSGCPPDEICMINCVCVKVTGGGTAVDTEVPNVCGDGIVGPEESCEFSVDDIMDSGCNVKTHICNEDCECESYAPSITIVEPMNGAIITELTSMEVETYNPYDTLYVTFYVDGDRYHTDHSEPYTIDIDPETWEEGGHTIRATLSSETTNQVKDEIDVFVLSEVSSCGNGMCEEGEYCDTCPEDCICEGGTCDPSDPLSDGIGCVYE